MKLTLLDLVQTILSSLDSDEVNSIGDTTESLQVTNIVRQAYFNIIARTNLPEHYKLFSLDASVDPDMPVLMTRPDDVIKLEWIKYDHSEDGVPSEPDYAYVTILPVKQFLDMVSQFNPDDAEVEDFSLDNKIFFYKNDRMPSFCTILEDRYIIFDSYDAAIDATLQSSKTQCYGQVSPEFLMEDSFIPSLDILQFPLLLNEAKALAFLELKQVAHDQAVQESKRQWRTLQRTKSLKQEKPFDQLADFGRKGSRYSSRSWS